MHIILCSTINEVVCRKSHSHNSITSDLCIYNIPFRDFNLNCGCTVGTGGGGDCPWYKSKTGEEHCVSSADFAGIHALSATPKECCHRHFNNVDEATCVTNSLADIAVVQAKDVVDLQRTKFYYPDLHGRRNCVYDSDYQDWMEEAVSLLYSIGSSCDYLHSHTSIDIK